ncbi:MAG: hypothetical protein ACRCZE_03385 [Candidatus Altimarinota bacterium]
MNKRSFLLHLVLSLLLTTQVSAQTIQDPLIIYNPSILQLITPIDTQTTTPDRETTVTPVETTDTVGQTDTQTPTDSTSTTTNNQPVGTVDNTEPEQPTATTEPETPATIGPGPERPSYTDTPTTEETTPPVTTVRPTRPIIPRPTSEVEETEPETPAENCPLFNPLDENPVKCPESAPIIPIFPIMMIAGPLAGLLLFFLIFKLLQNSHLKTETRLDQKRDKNIASQRSSAQKSQAYQDYLNFVSQSLTQTEFNQSDFLKQQAQLELFGSEQMLKLHQQVGFAFQENNHQEIKKLLPALITQIRLEE